MKKPSERINELIPVAYGMTPGEKLANAIIIYLDEQHEEKKELNEKVG